MANFEDSKAAALVKNTQELIDKVKQRSEAQNEFYRSLGLDPEKVKTVLEAHTGDKERAEAEALYRADMAAVEQEVAEEKARLSANQTNSNPIKRPRSIV